MVIGNLVSGNDGFAGVAICGNATFCGGGDFGSQSSNASGNIVQGNLVGTDVTGSAALGNTERGVSIDGAPNAVVGGTIPAERNVISANGQYGIYISSAGASGNQILGNYIGTDSSGLTALGNGIHGVVIVNGPNANVIGGTTSGAGNLISGNIQHGIQIIGLDTDSNLVQGNLIGTDTTGLSALGNGLMGIHIFIATNNTIGGTETGARNIVSGNGTDGINISSGGLPGGGAGNLVRGNFIGTNATGTGALANGSRGVAIDDAANNTIGGTTAGTRNLISGNGIVSTASGVVIFGSGATGNTVLGNYIGTNVNGTAALGNSYAGVSIELGASGNVIGGAAAGSGNVISGNGWTGVELRSSSNNLVEGNFIGTDASGTTSVGNLGSGVGIVDASDNTIGGTVPGSRNLISGNFSAGVLITEPVVPGNQATGNQVNGNYIGTDVSGAVALGNVDSGVRIVSASNNTIGGASPGSRNVISGNGFDGVTIAGAATFNVVAGNYIGTDGGGGVVLGNALNGVQILGSSHNTIGGSGPGAGNLISGNIAHGVSIWSFLGLGGFAATGNVVQGNRIGTDADGTADLGNAHTGVRIFRAEGNTIGGFEGEGNVISGNDMFGIEILGAGASGNMVQGNKIGTNAAGTSGVANGGPGVRIFDVPNNTVEGNTVAFNLGDGVLVEGASAGGNTLTQNAIHDNLFKGIENLNGGNTELSPPAISNVLGDKIEGTAPANSMVEVFADVDGEGRTFLGSVGADGSGNFMFSGLVSLPAGPNLTATATDGAGDTSEFSLPVPWVPDNCEINDVFDDACDVATQLGFGFASAGSFQSWVSGPSDVDWFVFDLPAPEPGSLVTVELTGAGGGDLPANFDLVVLAELKVDPGTGATPLQGVPLQGVPLQGVPLQGVPLQGVNAQPVPLQGVPLQGVEVNDIPLQGVPLQGVPLQGVPLQGVPLQGVPLQGVGFHQGSEPEQVSALFRGGMTGRFYVMVWSSTGEYSTSLDGSPYEVTVSAEEVTVETCTTPLDGVTLPEPLSGPLGDTVDPNSLILINRPRMAAYHGVGATDALVADLQVLATHPLVDGMIVDLGSYPDLTAAYADWDAQGCDPEVANLVTLEIKSIILDLLASDPTLENLVLVGNDLIIPYRRVPDEVVRTADGAAVPNEFDYQTELSGVKRIGVVETENNPTLTTLRLQYFLSDDFYADRAPVLLEHGHELSVPDLPIGRLVETPADIQEYIQVFLDHNGVMAPNAALTSLTTGYSFLIDQAEAIDSALAAKGFSPHSTLISDAWNRADFLNAYVNPPQAPEVDAVNAHFDHWQFAPADFTVDANGYVNSGDLLNTGDFEGATADLGATLFFSAGCHVGFNFWDGDESVYGDPGALDFPQVLVGRGVSLVGSWGFAYGDDAAIAYSEELMLNYARHLGAAGIGHALVEAKREYLLNQAALDPVHEKILMEAVFYGLPMWELTAPVPAPPSGISATVTTGTEDGLTVQDFQVSVDTNQRMQVTVAGRGSYLALAGQTQVAVYRPIEPQANLDVGGVSGEVAHGVLFTGGTYGDTPNFDPVITMPTWTRSSPEPQFLYEGWDPPRFWSLAQLERGDGSLDERLVLVPGQFWVDEAATQSGEFTVGIQRLYDTLDFEVFYAPVSAEFQPPIITSVNGGITSNPGAFFIVSVEDPPDAGGSASGIHRVVVTYTEAAGGSAWQSVDLTSNVATGLWEGTLQVTGSIDFFVQAVDGSGNVGMFAGNGYFSPAALSISGPSEARVGEQVTFTVTVPTTLSDGHVLWEFGDDAVAEGSASVVHTYSQPGQFTVQVRVVDSDGNLGQASFEVEVESPSHPLETLDEIRVALEGLPDLALRPPPENRRQSLLDKLAEVGGQIARSEFNGAIQKLEGDIRSKMDGCATVTGSPDGNDWIVDCSAQFELRALIDGLIADLQVLL